MKKVILTTLLISSLILIPLIGYDFFLLFFAIHIQQYAYFSVKELTGIDTIYIDNVKVGTTPFINKALIAGDHVITIEHEQNTQSYTLFRQTISFQPYTNNFVNIQLGPNDPFTFYSIFSLKKTSGQTGILVKISTPLDKDQTTTLNDKPLIPNSIVPEKEGNYKLLFQKENYLPYTTDVTITHGYVLEAYIHPFLKPL